MKNMTQVHRKQAFHTAQSWYQWCGISQCGEKGHVDFAVSLRAC